MYILIITRIVTAAERVESFFSFSISSFIHPGPGGSSSINARAQSSASNKRIIQLRWCNRRRTFLSSSTHSVLFIYICISVRFFFAPQFGENSAILFIYNLNHRARARFCMREQMEFCRSEKKLHAFDAVRKVSEAIQLIPRNSSDARTSCITVKLRKCVFSSENREEKNR